MIWPGVTKSGSPTSRWITSGSAEAISMTSRIPDRGIREAKLVAMPHRLGDGVLAHFIIIAKVLTQARTGSSKADGRPGARGGRVRFRALRTRGRSLKDRDARLMRFAEEQAALRRVATLVARGMP